MYIGGEQGPSNSSTLSALDRHGCLLGEHYSLALLPKRCGSVWKAARLRVLGGKLSGNTYLPLRSDVEEHAVSDSSDFTFASRNYTDVNERACNFFLVHPRPLVNRQDQQARQATGELLASLL